MSLVWGVLVTVWCVISSVMNTSVTRGVGLMASCLDSGASVDVTGEPHIQSTVNVGPTEGNTRLETASDTVNIDSKGDCEVTNGLTVTGGWLLPGMSTTLISLWQRMREGYSFTADVEGDVLTVHHALDEAQPVGQHLLTLWLDEHLAAI